jgi:hypothetical protein
VTLQRSPTQNELLAAVELTKKFGLEQLCRALVNCHEFVVVE